MADEDVTINNAFFEQLGRSAEVEALVMGIAEDVASAIRSGAPVDTGDYRNGFVVSKEIRQHRIVADVTGTDRKTMIIESRTGHMARTLQRAKRSSGRG